MSIIIIEFFLHFSNVAILIVCLFFYFLRFDSYFILDWLHRQAIKPQLIMRGSKILSLTVGSIRMIDTLSYMQMSLRVSLILYSTRAGDEKL